MASSQALSATRTSIGSVEPAEDQSVVCDLQRGAGHDLARGQLGQRRTAGTR